MYTTMSSANKGAVIKGVTLQYILYSDLRPQSKCFVFALTLDQKYNFGLAFD